MTRKEQKLVERSILLATFPEHLFRIRDRERPDFSIATVDGREFGVEITEFFANESIARLKKMPGYVDRIVHKQEYAHESDRQIMSVVQAEIQQPDGSWAQADMGVFTEVPNIAEQIKILDSLISDKSKDAAEYNYNGPIVLLVRDSNNLVSSVPDNKRPALLNHLSHLQSIVGSTFSDIILSWQSSEGNFAYSLSSNCSFSPKEGSPNLD